MPLDGVMIEWFKDSIYPRYAGESWSTLDECKYWNIVNEIRKALHGRNALEAEFDVYQAEHIREQQG